MRLDTSDFGFQISRRLVSRPACGARAVSQSRRRSRRGIALLEVVLALAVFFGVAVTILGGLSVCLRSAQQVREEAVAADLAITVLSELQMGLLAVADTPATPFEDPFADWTWQTTVTPVEAVVPGLEMTQVEIIVRSTLDGFTYRLYQLLPVEEEILATAPTMETASP